MKALTRGCHCAIRSRQDCVTSREESFLPAIAFATDTSDIRAGSPLISTPSRAAPGESSQARDPSAACRLPAQSRRRPGRWNWRCARRLPCPAGTPATSVIALTCLGSGLVMRRLLPCLVGRCAAVPRARNGHVARRLMAHCIDIAEFWRRICAERLRKRTAGVKPAAGRRVDRIGRIARDRRRLGAVIRIGRRHRRQQRPRIGMRRRIPDLVDRAELDHLAEIHHQHAVARCSAPR